jgi:Tc5 transposase DNA-binding domain/helix-turn-helix, Psq domain
MPPIRSQKAQKAVEQEGRILLAIRAIKNKEISSIRGAARTFEVPESTLRDRLHGHRFRPEARANNHKLTQMEEESLIQWILSMDLRGNPPRPSLAKDMANLLLASRGTTPPLTVGVNWVSNFIKRNADTIASRFSRRYDYRRAQCEDPTVIREWFDSV